MDEENAEENLKAFREKVGEDVKVFPISAIIHEGVDQVLYAVADALETAPKFDMEEIEENTVVYNFEEEEAPFVVHNLGNGQWTITGKKIERIVSMTSLVSDDAIKRLSIKCVIWVLMKLLETQAAKMEIQFQFLILNLNSMIKKSVLLLQPDFFISR